MEFIVPIRYIIKDYIDKKEISIEEISSLCNISVLELLSFLEDGLNLTENILKMMKILYPNINERYWINYQNKFEKHLKKQ